MQEVHDYLKTICPDLHVTRGEYDEDARYPETKTLTIGQFKLGLCHGHQVRQSFKVSWPCDCMFFAQSFMLKHTKKALLCCRSWRPHITASANIELYPNLNSYMEFCSWLPNNGYRIQLQLTSMSSFFCLLLGWWESDFNHYCRHHLFLLFSYYNFTAVTMLHCQQFVEDHKFLYKTWNWLFLSISLCIWYVMGLRN